MNTQIHELKRHLAAVDSSMSSAEAQLLIRDSRKDIEHGRRSIAKAIKIVDALDAQQVDGVLLSGPTAFAELPPFSGKEQTCDPLLSAAHEEWLPMATAPTDGTLVRLLVQFEEHSIDDGEGPFPTIGFNNVENDRLDEWQFAGWCWGHDHFTTGEGTPIGWLPLHGELVPGDEPTAPEALATKLIDTWCATHGGQIPWEKAVEITAVATSMSSEERERLLAMADTTTDQVPDSRPTLAYSVRGNRYLVTATRGEIGEPYTDAQIIELVERTPSNQAGQVPQAWIDVQTERRRQVETEGWSPEHDDEHACDEIAAFACLYAMPPAARDWDASSTGYGETLGQALLPENWRPKLGDRRRELIKAGALILAEIERLDRADAAQGGA
ncbi:hypothetical protein [Pseudomonas sp.]|uniref:hypothetical protein n=1 Tax=Pseudomonas sp. TaxID=306 RepID=UPI0029146B73|nr:hypothetical protein [Pseudomonas sp.]MDU4250512.1 hypothetical protein [Pseudomonas sp.]